MPKSTPQTRESTLRTRLVAADEQLRRLAHLVQLLEIQREGGPHGAFTDASGAVHDLEHLVELAGETLARVHGGAARKGPALRARRGVHRLSRLAPCRSRDGGRGS